MKKREAIILCSILVLLLIVSAGMAILVGRTGKQANKTEVNEMTDDKTFADWTEHAALSQVPALIVEGSKMGEAFDVGAGNALIDVERTTLEDYTSYLKLLEKTGYKKLVDNGKSGLAESVYATTYTKDKLAVNITHIVATGKTYISAGENQVFSPNLFYDDSYVAENTDGAKTKLHLFELTGQGNCLIVQLKNGHFIVSDTGQRLDVPYLLDYLEKLAPQGQKPVIEALFFTHSHGDHASIMEYLTAFPEAANRIIVEGVYFNEPGKAAVDQDSTNRSVIQNIKLATSLLRTSKGEKTTIYRPQTGQKYYFNDVVIDIVMGQEQIFPSSYFTDLNESSTVSMLNIDGQKVLLPGDSGAGLLRGIMAAYENARGYFEMNVMVAYHHTFDTWSTFTDFCKMDTILVTRSEAFESAINKHFLEAAKEHYAYGKGTVVLTFPYHIGEAETNAPMERIYTTADVYPVVEETVN